MRLKPDTTYSNYVLMKLPPAVLLDLDDTILDDSSAVEDVLARCVRAGAQRWRTVRCDTGGVEVVLERSGAAQDRTTRAEGREARCSQARPLRAGDRRCDMRCESR